MLGKHVKTILIFVLTLAVLPFSVSCQATENVVEKSNLYGTFTYQETLGLEKPLTITNDADAVVTDRDKLISTVYPLNGGQEGARVSYNMDARLKLNRDFTYKYEYTLLLSNPGEWGQQFARLTVTAMGSFRYIETDVLGKYEVILDNPTSGKQTVYSFHVSRGDIYGWAMHGTPDYVVDYSVVSAVKDYEYDLYSRARLIGVNKNDKTLQDNLFDQKLMNYFSTFATY